MERWTQGRLWWAANKGNKNRIDKKITQNSYTLRSGHRDVCAGNSPSGPGAVYGLEHQEFGVRAQRVTRSDTVGGLPRMRTG